MLGTFAVVVEWVGVSGETVKRGRKFSKFEAYVSEHYRTGGNHPLRNSSDKLTPAWGPKRLMIFGSGMPASITETPLSQPWGC